jgi:hypothetical protein
MIPANMIPAHIKRQAFVHLQYLSRQQYSRAAARLAAGRILEAIDREIVSWPELGIDGKKLKELVQQAPP